MSEGENPQRKELCEPNYIITLHTLLYIVRPPPSSSSPSFTTHLYKSSLQTPYKTKNMSSSSLLSTSTILQIKFFFLSWILERPNLTKTQARSQLPASPPNSSITDLQTKYKTFTHERPLPCGVIKCSNCDTLSSEAHIVISPTGQAPCCVECAPPVDFPTGSNFPTSVRFDTLLIFQGFYRLILQQAKPYKYSLPPTMPTPSFLSRGQGLFRNLRTLFTSMGGLGHYGLNSGSSTKEMFSTLESYINDFPPFAADRPVRRYNSQIDDEVEFPARRPTWPPLKYVRVEQVSDFAPISLKRL